MEKDRDHYLDILRIIAALAVVIGHVASKHWDDTGVMAEWISYHLWNAAVRWTIPVFVMISGALFLDRSRNVTVKKLYSRNILRVVTAFFFWSVLYAAWDVLRDGWDGVGAFLSQVMSGRYHLWFLPMLTGLYILTPVLRDLSEQTQRYLLLVSFVLCFTVAAFFETGDALLPLVGRSGAVKLYQALHGAGDNFFTYFHLDYIPYFLLGHQLHGRSYSKRQLRVAALLLTTGFLFTALFPLPFALGRNLRLEQVYNAFSLNILFESVGVFVLTGHCCRNLRPPGRAPRLWRLTAEASACTFGLYLVHIWLLDIAADFLHCYELPLHKAFLVPLLSVAIFLIGLLIAALLRRVPFLRRWIV